MSYHISPDVFFLVEDDRLLVWNCRTHQQYKLDPNFTNTLLNLSNHNPSCRPIIDQLMRAGIVVQHAPSTQWGFDALSYLFHLGTKDVPCDDGPNNDSMYANQYLEQCQQLATNAPNWFQEKPGALVDLPPPDLTNLNGPYHTVIQQRLTCRQFNEQPISLQQLSDFLYSSFGLIHGDWLCNNDQLTIAGVRKSSASSGGLHAEEAYIVIYRVNSIKPGLYYYRPQDHKLNAIKYGNFEQEVISWNKRQYFSKGLAAGIYITARLDKYWWKYPHSRTYRIMLMDMGHVSQTALLNATALGLQTWITGALEDSPIEQFLEIDKTNESIMLFLGVGHGNGESLPKHFQ